MNVQAPQVRITTREVCRRTGLSKSHWQLRAKAGEVPGVIRYGRGKRSVFLWDEAVFMAWWEKQGAPTCRIAISGNVGASSGIGSGAKERISKAPSTQTAKRLRAIALREKWKN